MLPQNLLQNRSPVHATLSVCATLSHRQTLSLLPRSAGVVRVTQGRLWLTLDGPHAGPANAWGDHVLSAGQSMTLRGGQRLLVEAWPVDGGAISRLEWLPEPTVCGALTTRLIRQLMKIRQEVDVSYCR